MSNSGTGAGTSGQDRYTATTTNTNTHANTTTVIKTHALRRATSMPFGRQYHGASSGGLAAAKGLVGGSQGDGTQGKCTEASVLHQAGVQSGTTASISSAAGSATSSSVSSSSPTVTAWSGAGMVDRGELGGGGEYRTPLKLRSRAPTASPSFGGSGGVNGGVSTSNENIEILFSHSQSRITGFSTENSATQNILETNPTESESLIPYNARGERLLATGPLKLYRAKPHNIAFIQSGKLLHPVMARSQCWCVDQEDEVAEGEVDGVTQAGRGARGMFVLRIRSGEYWRIEINGLKGESQPDAVKAFKKVLKKILAYEKATCPFQRKLGFDVDWEEEAEEEVAEEIIDVGSELLRRKVPYNMKKWGIGEVMQSKEEEEVKTEPGIKENGEVATEDRKDEEVPTESKEKIQKTQIKFEAPERGQDHNSSQKTIKTELTYTAIPSPNSITPRARRQRGRASPSSPQVRSRATSPRPTTSSSAQYMPPVLESFDDLLMSTPGSPSTPTQPYIHNRRASAPRSRSTSMRINTNAISGIGYSSPTASVTSLPMLCTSATSASSSFTASSYFSTSPPNTQFSSPPPMDIHDWTHIVTKAPSKPASPLLSRPPSSSSSSRINSRASSVNPGSSLALRKPLPIPPVTTRTTTNASTSSSANLAQDLGYDHVGHGYNPLQPLTADETRASFFANLHAYNENHFTTAAVQPTLRRAISTQTFARGSAGGFENFGNNQSYHQRGNSGDSNSSSSSSTSSAASNFFVNMMLGIANKISVGKVWGAVHSLGEMIEEGLVLGENASGLFSSGSEVETEGGEDDEDEEWWQEEEDEDEGNFGAGVGVGVGVGFGFAGFAERENGENEGWNWNERRRERAGAIPLRRV